MSERQFLKLLFYLLLFSTGIVGLSVLLLSGVAIYRLESEPKTENHSQIYDMATRSINLTEKILLLLGGGTTLIGGLREIQLNRSKSGHEFLLGTILDKALKIRNQLARYGYDIYSNSVQCPNTAMTTGNDKYLIISFLNYLDYMCIALDKEIIDEELVKDSAKYLILKSWFYFQPAIKEFRNNANAPDAWKSIEEKCNLWK
ncbi:MAG: DUF4760 domain-containing protein [Microcystis aeruginosa L211-07]|jgi:hypothetical protein|nr:DUF4760 domain-containing protein [Microcystis aeruginosa L211-07]